MPESIEKVRSRNWCLLLYPEDPTHVRALELLEEHKYRYVGIRHDKDVWSEQECKDGKHVVGDIKKEHWHIVIKCKQARWNTAISKDLGIAPNYLQICADFDEAVLYLTHVNQPEKHQYESTEAFGNLTGHLEKLLLDEDEGTRVLEIVKCIDSQPGLARYRDILVYCCNNGLYGEFRRLGCGVKYLLDEHNADVQADVIRDRMERFEKAGTSLEINDFGRYQQETGLFHEAIRHDGPELPLERL